MAAVGSDLKLVPLQRVTSLDPEDEPPTATATATATAIASAASAGADSKSAPTAAAAPSSVAPAPSAPLKLTEPLILALTTHQSKPHNPLHLTDDELQALAHVLASPIPIPPLPLLTCVNMSNANLRDEQLIQLCVGLAQNKSLTLLKLSSNRISDKGCIALCQALKTQTGLVTLGNSRCLRHWTFCLFVMRLTSNLTRLTCFQICTAITWQRMVPWPWQSY
jgi:hypothetical protein